jgi:hypothetical protein
LIGVLAYPSTYVKLESRLAISLLSRYLHAPTKDHFKISLRTLMYCVGTHDIGIMYSRGLDEHGVNTLYAYAESNFESPKSTGGRQVYEWSYHLCLCTATQHGGHLDDGG